MDKSDYELACEAYNGSVEAFGCLYIRYYKSMVAIAVSFLRRSDLAEDIAQETFVIAAQNIQRLHQPEKFAAWLAGICRNTSRNWLRKRKEEPLSGHDIFLQADQPGGPDLETQKLIRQAVWALPSRSREIIILRYYDGLSYEQIAKITDLSVQAVNGRLGRTKKKISSYLRKKGIEL